MCISSPKIPAPVPPAQLQSVQQPKQLAPGSTNNNTSLRRRGLFASIFTGPQGVLTPPSVTGTGGGVTGG